MNQHFRDLAEHTLEKNVEENSHPDRWLVYEHYETIPDEAGSRYLHAPPRKGDTPNKYHRLRPLSRTSADLFLRFAQWPEETGMDKELDTPRNTEAALAWAHNYGVLGLNPTGMVVLNILNSHRVTADYLGMPWLGDAGRGYQNLATGGRPHESVANFAFEAWEAHIVWRLYEAVRSGGAVDDESVTPFMSTIDHFDTDPDMTKNITRGESISIRDSWVEREIFSGDAELMRRWALTVVGDAVNRKIENHCYPILRGDAPSSYEPGWGFRSLLGAMWLQMMFLMREDRRCRWCGKPLDPGMRSHAKYCDNDDKCKAAWNYHEGTGASSKEKRRQSRYRR
jgi:hypothetical protein